MYCFKYQAVLKTNRANQKKVSNIYMLFNCSSQMMQSQVISKDRFLLVHGSNALLSCLVTSPLTSCDRISRAGSLFGLF